MERAWPFFIKQRFEDEEAESDASLDKGKKSAVIPPRECKMCTLSKRVICTLQGVSEERKV
jgi:hypothetical protein